MTDLIREQDWERDPPLTCRQVIRILQAYLDTAVDDRTARQAAAHLEDCRRCGLEAQTYRAIKDALARHQRATPTAVARLQTLASTPQDTAPAPQCATCCTEGQ